MFPSLKIQRSCIGRWAPLLALLIPLRLAGAQTVSPSVAAPSSTVAPSSLTPQEYEVQTLFLHGDYDAAIEKATQALTSAKGDPRLLYFRGYSAFDNSSYDSAYVDFKAIGDFKPYNKWDPARQFVNRMDEMKALAPPNTYEIKDNGGAVVFRVYYDVEDEWAQAVVALLPQASRINHDLFGEKAKETPVFIFSDSGRYHTFVHARTGLIPGTWTWDFGSPSGLYFCENKQAAAQDTKSAYFRGSIVHEYNHYAVGNITHGASLPTWFSEGLAMSTEPVLAPELQGQFGQGLRQAVEANSLLPMKTMTAYSSFQEAMEQQTAHLRKSDPYNQGWSMTCYFLTLVPPAKITAFLEDVRDSRDFDKSLRKFTDLSPDEFYDGWLKALSKDQSGSPRGNTQN